MKRKPNWSVWGWTGDEWKLVATFSRDFFNACYLAREYADLHGWLAIPEGRKPKGAK